MDRAFRLLELREYPAGSELVDGGVIIFYYFWFFIRYAHT